MSNMLDHGAYPGPGDKEYNDKLFGNKAMKAPQEQPAAKDPNWICRLCDAENIPTVSCCQVCKEWAGAEATGKSDRTDNELIAEFMGWVFIKPSENGIVSGHYEKSEDWIDTEQMKYDTSWDWLMPVVEKINKIVRAKDLTDQDGNFIYKEASSRLTPIHNEMCNVNIHNTHFCVVKWLEWYNSNKKA